MIPLAAGLNPFAHIPTDRGVDASLTKVVKSGPMKPSHAGLLGLLTTIAIAGAARADDLRDLCPDRPLRGVSACSVDQGHWQLETDFANWTRDKSGGATTDTLLAPNPTLKYGVSSTVDVEATFAPYQFQRIKSGGVSASNSGIGDLTLGVKWHISGTNGQDGFGLLPFIKLPTAKHALGNGAVEGGVYAPWQASLPLGWSVDITPELDLFKNENGAGRHLATTASVGVSHPLGPVFNINFEVWGRRDFDPGGATQQWTFDTALVWQPKGADYAFDAEVDFGLNRQTPDAQFIVGLSKRF
jgi:hypothetical protein